MWILQTDSRLDQGAVVMRYGWTRASLLNNETMLHMPFLPLSVPSNATRTVLCEVYQNPGNGYSKLSMLLGYTNPFCFLTSSMVSIIATLSFQSIPSLWTLPSLRHRA